MLNIPVPSSESVGALRNLAADLACNIPPNTTASAKSGLPIPDPVTSTGTDEPATPSDSSGKSGELQNAMAPTPGGTPLPAYKGPFPASKTDNHLPKPLKMFADGAVGSSAVLKQAAGNSPHPQSDTASITPGTLTKVSTPTKYAAHDVDSSISSPYPKGLPGKRKLMKHSTEQYEFSASNTSNDSAVSVDTDSHINITDSHSSDAEDMPMSQKSHATSRSGVKKPKK